VQLETSNVGRACSEYADMILVITIPERRAYIQETMKLWKIPAVIFAASEKDKLERKQLIEEGILTAESTVTLGQAACCLSNKNVMRHFLASDSQRCLIFQDDITVPQASTDFSHLEEALAAVPKSFDMIYLGRSDDNRFTTKKIAPHVVRTFAPTCLHAIMVSRKGAAKILALKPLMQHGLDIRVKQAIQKKVIESYAITPPVFFQNREKWSSTLERSTQFFGLKGGNGVLREYSLLSSFLYYGLYLSAAFLLGRAVIHFAI